MKGRPVLSLVMSLCSSLRLNVADRIVESSLYERRYDTSRLISNVPAGEARSLLQCGALCARSSSCDAFCYSDSMSTALCHLSQPYEASLQEYDVSDSKCYNPAGCPMTQGYAWYGARCIKGYAERKNYTAARAICTQDGGHLYHYMDLEWDRKTIEDLRADMGTMGSRLWMGADSLETPGQFQWSDSSLLANGSSLWLGGLPRDAPAYSCVRLGGVVYFLTNAGCSDTLKFVCQVDV